MNQRILRNQHRVEKGRTGRSFFKGAAMLLGLLLLTINSFAQYVPITHTAGTVAYGGVNVTVSASGGTTYASTCTPTLHYQTFTAGSSWTYTFSSPVAS